MIPSGLCLRLKLTGVFDNSAYEAGCKKKIPTKLFLPIAHRRPVKLIINIIINTLAFHIGF
jgi:hypothetical protein